jgi:stearoyl-CoA desaturase (delta-9 desaturase)
MTFWEITRSRGEFMVGQMLVGLIALIVLPFTTDLDWQWLWVTLAIVVVFNVVLIEAYLHRWCAHRTYELYKPVEYTLAILASVVPGTGSTAGWAALHKAHHVHVDSPLDPHSPHHSSVLDMLLWRYPNIGTLHSSRGLLADPLHRSLHKYYVLWMVAWFLMWAIPFGVNGAFFAVILPWALAPIMSTIQNIGLHVKLPFTYRNFVTMDKSQNSIWMHLFSFGCAGWHNNHHRYPGRQSIKEKWWEFDTAAWMIALLKRR